MGPTRLKFATKVQLGESLVILRDSVSTEVVGRNIGATTERLCGSKESLGFSLNYGLRRGAEVLC